MEAGAAGDQLVVGSNPWMLRSCRKSKKFLYIHSPELLVQAQHRYVGVVGVGCVRDRIQEWPLLRSSDSTLSSAASIHLDWTVLLQTPLKPASLLVYVTRRSLMMVDLDRFPGHGWNGRRSRTGKLPLVPVTLLTSSADLRTVRDIWTPMTSVLAVAVVMASLGGCPF